MKKLLFLSLFIFTVVFFTACGTSGSTSEKPNEEEEVTADTPVADEHDHEHEGMEPNEPTNETVCAVCNMKVYQKDHEMGVFTAQGITEAGENIFFDDIGCILNYERKTGEKLEKKWVRDYETLEWTEIDAATPVKTNLKSPMKWGYTFFDSEEKANTFVEENPDKEPSLAEWSVIDEAAAERLKKKMQAQMQNQEESNDMNMDMNEEDSSSK